MLEFLQFFLIGISVSTFGSLVGAGGGFILTPVLLLLFPSHNSEIIAATSLFVVATNSISGTTAYLRLKRIDVKTGLIYGLAAFPFAILGTILTAKTDRSFYDLFLGTSLLLLCLSLFQGPPKPIALNSEEQANKKNLKEKRIVTRNGKEYHYFFYFKRGIWVSSGLGFLASFFGIGGGPLYVPTMIRFLRIPVHIATATSQFICFLASTTAVIAHTFQGNSNTMVGILIPLAIGAVLGGQIGARISERVKSDMITKIFIILLGIIACRLLYQGINSFYN